MLRFTVMLLLLVPLAGALPSWSWDTLQTVRVLGHRVASGIRYTPPTPP